MIAAAIYNNNPNRKKGSPRAKASDFVREPVREVTPKEMDRIMRSWAAGIGLEVVDA